METQCQCFLSTGARQGRSSARTVAFLVALLMVCAAGGGAIYYFVLSRADELGVVAQGKLYRSAQPSGWEYSVLDRLSIRRVISLRGYREDPELLEEEKAACAAAGAEFVHIPVESRLPTEEQIGKFMRAVQTAPGPVLVHCEHGKTRAGIMSAAYRVMVQGWSPEQAIESQLVGYHPSVDADKRTDAIDLTRRFKANHSDMLK